MTLIRIESRPAPFIKVTVCKLTPDEMRNRKKVGFGC